VNNWTTELATRSLLGLPSQSIAQSCVRTCAWGGQPPRGLACRAGTFWTALF